jgi:hypothetical protein
VVLESGVSRPRTVFATGRSCAGSMSLIIFGRDKVDGGRMPSGTRCDLASLGYGVACEMAPGGIEVASSIALDSGVSMLESVP